MSSKHLKPIYWGIFSAGGTVAALALAPLVLVVCVLLPMGVLGHADSFYQSVHGFFANPLVFVVFAALIFTLMWHGVHRFYYILHDLHIPVGNAVRLGFYALAVLAFLVTLLVGLV